MIIADTALSEHDKHGITATDTMALKSCVWLS